ncbi:MAG: glycosyltransferase [Pyrinomonadaceae bacterium]
MVLILLSLKSFLGGIEYLRYFKTQIAKPRSGYTPFLTIIAPSRGLDDGLADNLQALFDQDYPDHEIVFVVDDPADRAVGVINEVCQITANKRVKTKLVVAPKAVGCSQKVENLREGVLHAADASELFVFVDSDVRPASDWLRDLAAPLEDENTGASTGYRWFISKRPTFASELRSAWNASIASSLGPNTRSNFCWGGSMAIRRDIFDRLDMRERWVGTLSDDLALTRELNKADLPIIFVPQALTASIEDCTFGGMLEFTTRQIKITRVYAPKLWLLSFLGSGLFNVVMISAFLIVIFARQNNFSVFAATSTLIIVTVLSTAKAWLRLNSVKLVLTEHRTKLTRQFWTQNTLWLLSPAIFFYNSLAAWSSRRMKWRGTVYELKSRTETVIIAD